MNLDLFADAAPPVPQRSPSDLPVRAGVNRMECVLGDPGRWIYRDEVILHDRRLEGRGAWATVEGVGRPRVASDDLAQVQAAVDQRAAPGAHRAG